jgi:predicted metal-dependent hydrolase
MLEATSQQKSSVQIAGQTVPIVFARHPTARVYRLTLRRDGTFRCTIPLRGTLEAAKAFTERHADWMKARLEARAKRPATPREWFHGIPVLFRGESFPLDAAADSHSLILGPLRLPRPRGVEADLRPHVERHLRALAALELPRRTRELANLHGFEVRAVQIRNQRSRWGSCSARGVVSLNWHLIQLPPEVSDYIILHELAHLRFLNHSARFWAEVARICPGYEAAERWIKNHGGLVL